MLQCTCCKRMKIYVDQYLGLYRIRYNGFIVKDVPTVQEVEEIVAGYGMTLAKFEEIRA